MAGNKSYHDFQAAPMLLHFCIIYFRYCTVYLLILEIINGGHPKGFVTCKY